MIIRTAIQASTLHTCNIRHNFQLGIKRAATISAEEVIVQFSAVALYGVFLRCSLREGEGGTGDHDVGGVCCTGPFLTVGAVAEGCCYWIALQKETLVRSF